MCYLTRQEIQMKLCNSNTWTNTLTFNYKENVVMTRFDLIFYCDRRKFNLTGGFLIFLFMLTGWEITFYLQHWYCCKILYPKMFAGGPHYASAISGGQFLRFFWNVVIQLLLQIILIVNLFFSSNIFRGLTSVNTLWAQKN